MKWTKERIAALKTAEVRQLRANAERLREIELVADCDEVLGGRPKTAGPKKVKRQHELDGRPLVSRSKAFEMRGVKLHNPRWSWGGVRADGTVVFTIWANEIERDGNICRYLLWGPNHDGRSPWSDKPGGKERLKHCQLAMANGSGGEGVIIYGATSGLDLPPTAASKVSGADPHTVLRFQVRKEGDDYWAVWTHQADVR